MALIPLIDSIVLQALKNEKQFGNYRSYGALGAGIGIFTGGQLVN